MTPQTEHDLLAAIGRRQVVATAADKEPGSLIVDGDSWASYPEWAAGGNLTTALEKRWENVFKIASNGHKAEGIAFDKGQYDEMVRAFAKLDQADHPPRGIVLSAAGNDFVDVLHVILNRYEDVGAPDQIDPDVARGVFNRIERSIERIVQLYDFLGDHFIGTPLPVVSHTYSYPLRLGRAFLGIGLLPGPWIEPKLRERGYGELDIEERRLIVARTVDMFWGRLSALSARVPSLHFVDARNVATSEDDWADEMHLVGSAYDRLGAMVHAKLMEVVE